MHVMSEQGCRNNLSLGKRVDRKCLPLRCCKFVGTMGHVLPDLVMHKVAQYVADISVVQLVALAGVSTSWRCIVKELCVSELKFESCQDFQQTSSLQRDALATRFYRGTCVQKRATFIAASKLLVKHKSVALRGEAIADALVKQLAFNGVERVFIEGSASVTDGSLTSLMLHCPNLKELQLISLFSLEGGFLPAMLRRATQLETLVLVDLPKLSWDFVTLCCDTRHFLPKLKRLTLRHVPIDLSHLVLFERFPKVQSCKLECNPATVWSVIHNCRGLAELFLTVNSSSCADDCLAALLSAPSIKVLELCPRGFTLSAEQLRLAGMLNLQELRLESHAFKKQPLNRVSVSHIDNAGVKALVDSICNRCLFQSGRQPFKLSLCGATGITHDAVSSLLRLPLLSGLLLDGCHRISSIDKMRLVAKVKAGRELLEDRKRKSHPQLGRRRLLAHVP